MGEHLSVTSSWRRCANKRLGFPQTHQKPSKKAGSGVADTQKRESCHLCVGSDRATIRSALFRHERSITPHTDWQSSCSLFHLREGSAFCSVITLLILIHVSTNPFSPTKDRLLVQQRFAFGWGLWMRNAFKSTAEYLFKKFAWPNQGAF